MTHDELVKEEDLFQEQGFNVCRGGALKGMRGFERVDNQHLLLVC